MPAVVAPLLLYQAMHQGCLVYKPFARGHQPHLHVEEDRLTVMHIHGGRHTCRSPLCERLHGPAALPCLDLNLDLRSPFAPFFQMDPPGFCALGHTEDEGGGKWGTMSAWPAGGEAHKPPGHFNRETDTYMRVSLFARSLSMALRSSASLACVLANA